MPAPASPISRLAPIEGLRAYLALWVVMGHIIACCGITYPQHNTSLVTAAIIFFNNADCAVFIFMIISGFVIFFLLDKKKENLRQFIVRRFFRLYPVYILLLVASILLNNANYWAIQHSTWMNPSDAHAISDTITESKKHLGGDVFAHLIMLQGVAPESLLGKTSAYSFLGPAYSIAIEWQFYLIAPLLYAAASALKPSFRIISAIMLGALIVYFEGGLLPRQSTFILHYLPHFLVGIASFYLLKSFSHRGSNWASLAFPLALAVAALLDYLEGSHRALIPFIYWAAFLALLFCVHANTALVRLALSIFNNGLIQFLGAISYCIYLSHGVVITILQYLLASELPHLGKLQHFYVLLVLTLLGTLFLSIALHYLIELPGMELGRKLALRLGDTASPKPKTLAPS